MKSKKEYIILGIAIAVLAAYLALHRTNQTHYKLPVIKKLTDVHIDDIKITKGDKNMELKKTDDRWLIYPKKYPADKNKIDPMVNIIKNLTVTAMVSETGSSYARYELDPKNKITVQAKADGKLLRAFDIGKVAPSNRHTFIKLPDDKRVYHAQENFRSKFDKSIDDLRDKTVLHVDRNQIHRVEIKNKDGKVMLSMQQVPAEEKANAESKSKEKVKAASVKSVAPKLVWQDAAGNPVKDADVKNFFNNVSNLKCQSYITGKTKDDFKNPLYTVTMSGTQTYTLSLFPKINKNDDTYPATSSESDYVFTLPVYKVNSMIKK